MRKRKGAISIFAAVLTAAVMILTCVAIDVTRAGIFQVKMARAADSALRSVMADYDEILYREYGICALETGEGSTGRVEDFYRYFKVNLNGLGGDKARVNECDLIGFGSILQPDLLENQILEYMKYRAPAYLASGLLEDLNILKDSSVVSQTVDTFKGSLDTVKEQGGALGDILELFKIGEAIMKLSAIKTELKSDDLKLPAEWLITEAEKSKLFDFDTSIFEKMSAANVMPDMKSSAGLLTKLSDALFEARDNIYIASYIMEKFSNYSNLTGEGRYFSGGEVEYVLFGDDVRGDNINNVFNLIFLMRFGLNAIEAAKTYANSEPATAAILTALSAAMGACEDTRALFDGDDITLVPGITAIKADYMDHLMLMAILAVSIDKQGVLSRITNLVQVNIKNNDTDRSLTNFTSALKCETTAELKFLFINLNGKAVFKAHKTLYRRYA